MRSIALHTIATHFYEYQRTITVVVGLLLTVMFLMTVRTAHSGAILWVTDIPSSVTTMQSESARRFLAEANHLISLGDVHSGRKIIQQWLQQEPRNSIAWLKLGQIYLLNDPEKALASARYALSTHASPFPEALNLLSVAYERLSQTARLDKEEASLRKQQIKDYTQYLQEYPTWKALLYRRASQRLALQRLMPALTNEIDLAIIDLKELASIFLATDSSKEKTSTYFQLGRAYKHKADSLMTQVGDSNRAAAYYKKALKNLKESLSIDPNRIDALGEIVLIHIQLDQKPAALLALQEHQPKFTQKNRIAKGHEMLGAMLVQLKQYPQAQIEFKKALELNPILMGVYMHLSAIYNTQGNKKKSEKILKESIQVDPFFLNSYSRLGTLYLNDGQYTKAIKIFETALKIPPHFAVTLGMTPSKSIVRNRLYYYFSASLAWLYLENKALEKALATAQLAQKFQVIDIHLMDTIGSIYMAKGEYSKALQVFIKIIEKDDLPNSHLQLAKIFIANGEQKKAREHLNIALSSEAPFYSKQEAIELVDGLNTSSTVD